MNDIIVNHDIITKEGETMNLLDIVELRKKPEVPVAEYQQIKASQKNLNLS